MQVYLFAYLTNFSNLLALGCMSMWCPCIVYSKNKQRLRSLKTQGTPLPGGGDTFDGDCCIYTLLDMCGLGCILQVCLRWLTRCIYMVPLTRPPLLRLEIAAIFVIAMPSVGAHVAIAFIRGAAVRVLSRRNAGKLSWRRTVSK